MVVLCFAVVDVVVFFTFPVVVDGLFVDVVVGVVVVDLFVVIDFVEPTNNVVGFLDDDDVAVDGFFGDGDDDETDGLTTTVVDAKVL